MAKLDDLLPLWLTPAQVAKHLQVSQNTIYNMVHAKQLPHRWIGGRIRIPRSVLQEDAECLDVTRSRTTKSDPTKTVAFPASSTQP